MYDTGAEEDGFPSSIDTLPDESNDRGKGRDSCTRDYQDSGEQRRDQKNQNYDSGDSDDYAESDN